MKILYKLFFLLFVLVCSKASAQLQVSPGVSSDGRDFYIGYIKPSYPNDGKFTNSYVLVSSYTNTSVTISYFNNAGDEKTSQVYMVPARTGLPIILDTRQMLMDEPGDIPQYRACHITSDHPVNVQYFGVGICAGGSYLAMTTEALGKKYVAASYNDNPGLGNPGAIGEIAEGIFLITAAFDNTEVKITPNASTKGGHPGMHGGKGATGVESPYTVKLNRGQCYMVKSGSNDEEVDISGSLIESNKPVAVISGHENALLGGAGETSFDARDFMIEQMMPAECWDTMGYVSIPLKDSQPLDPASEGAGDNYRVYSFDPGIADIKLEQSGIGSINFPSLRLQKPPTERFGVTTPVEFHCNNGRKFSVMQYDLRNHLTNAPFPAPSMMTVVPISRWKKSFLWYVPTNQFNIYQVYSATLIAETSEIPSILVSFNGGTLKPLKQVLTSDGQYIGLPGHPELSAYRFKLGPGSYYAESKKPFIVYNTGFRAVDPDFDLNPEEGNFFSYANPAGAMFTTGDEAKLRTVIDSDCTSWNICATDDRSVNPGIRNISLLNDPAGVQSTPAKQSFNCHLDPFFDPNNVGEVQLDGTNKNVCFNVLIDDPFSIAYAAVFISDNAGNTKIVELHYSPPVFSRSPAGSSVSFGGTEIKKDTCINFTIKNIETIPHTVQSAILLSNNHFTISSIKPALPALLRKNDSVIIKVCYNASDTLLAQNSLSVVVDCFTLPVGLSAKGASGIINATDQNFGVVDTGKSLSKNIEISNIGTKTFIVTGNWKLTGSSAFAFEDKSLLPTSLNPGGKLPLKITYSPVQNGFDTATITWDTDIENPYKQSIKTYSRLTGQGSVKIAKVENHIPTLKLSVRPNPASGSSIILSFSDEELGIKEIGIFDLLGRELYKKNVLIHANTSEEIELPIFDLQNGTYYARISSAGKIVTEKFEVQR